MVTQFFEYRVGPTETVRQEPKSLQSVRFHTKKSRGKVCGVSSFSGQLDLDA